MGYLTAAYKAALLPGILAVSLAFSSVQSVALPMVADFGWTREIEDRLLAPISLELIALEKIVSGVIQGLIAALFVLPIARIIMGPIEGLTVTHFALVIFIVLLGATAFSVLGLLMGTLVSPQQIGLMFSVIVAPMIFFGCAYYPWQNLSVFPAMKYAVLDQSARLRRRGDARRAHSGDAAHGSARGECRAHRHHRDLLDARPPQLHEARDGVSAVSSLAVLRGLDPDPPRGHIHGLDAGGGEQARGDG